MSDEHWMQEAYSKHKGSLTRFAKKHRFMHKDGTIDLKKCKAYAEKNHLENRLKQINLVETTEKINRKKANGKR